MSDHGEMQWAAYLSCSAPLRVWAAWARGEADTVADWEAWWRLRSFEAWWEYRGERRPATRPRIRARKVTR